MPVVVMAMAVETIVKAIVEAIVKAIVKAIVEAGAIVETAGRLKTRPGPGEGAAGRCVRRPVHRTRRRSRMEPAAAMKPATHRSNESDGDCYS